MVGEMADITFNCERCCRPLTMDERAAKIQVNCPSCGQSVTVPQPKGCASDTVENLLRKFEYRGVFDPIGWQGTNWTSSDRDWHDRNAAAFQIRDLGKLAVPALLRALSSAKHGVRRTAAEILLRLNDPSLSPIMAYLEDCSREHSYSEPIPSDAAEFMVHCIIGTQAFDVHYVRPRFTMDSAIGPDKEVWGVDVEVLSPMVFTVQPKKE
jgi:hypothetical protein